MTKYIILQGTGSIVDLKFGRIYEDINEAFAARSEILDGLRKTFVGTKYTPERINDTARKVCKVYKIEEALGN